MLTHWISECGLRIKSSESFGCGLVRGKPHWLGCGQGLWHGTASMVFTSPPLVKQTTASGTCCTPPSSAPLKAPHIRESGIKLSSWPEKTTGLQFHNLVEPKPGPDTSSVRNCPRLSWRNTIIPGTWGAKGMVLSYPSPRQLLVVERGASSLLYGQPSCMGMEPPFAGYKESLGQALRGLGISLLSSSSPHCFDFPQSFSWV